MWCLFILRYDDFGVDLVAFVVVVASKYTEKHSVETIFTHKFIVKFTINNKVECTKVVLLFAEQLQACFQHQKAQVFCLVYIRAR